MNTELFLQELDLRKRLMALEAENKQLSRWEIEMTQEIQRLIVQQGQNYDEIVQIETKLAALKSKGQREGLLYKLGRIL